MSGDEPLIVITREAGAGAELARALASRGLRAWHVPAIVIEPSAEPSMLDQVLEDVADLDWLVFTSPRAVDVTCTRRVWPVAWHAMSGRARVATVGPATAARLAAHGISSDVTADESTGRGLPAAMARRSGSLVGRRVLWPRGDRARTGWMDSLARDGVRVIAPVAYFTRWVPADTLAPLIAAIDARRVAAVTFFSPSSAESLTRAFAHRTLGALKGAVAIAAIGPTTAEVLTALGAPPDVIAERPTPEALADALARHVFQARSP